MKTKVLTIYLPQFHVIPENNEWWGNGFTEWTNVKRGKPFYPGHYQPRVPLHHNYYDLSDLKVLERHIHMAQKAKIYGFAFYHYYFAGKKLLEKPIQQYRDLSYETFPYCLIWANQSWSRTWYRADAGKKVLLQQIYGNQKQWREHFWYLLSFFQDPRYIKVDNKPIYIIYLPQDIECRKDMFEEWNNLAIKNGFSGMFLIAMNTGWGLDLAQNLYDAYMNFEPIHMMNVDISWRKQLENFKRAHINDVNSKKQNLKNYIFSQNTYSYSYLCRQIEKGIRTASKKKTLFGTFAGWDNTSRKDEAGFIVKGSNPVRFGKHMKNMLELSEAHENEYLFLNAWNEWSEGAYIEPDEKYGYSYLKELRKSISQYEQSV